MKKTKIIPFVLFLIIISLFVLTGCQEGQNNSNDDVKEKVSQELDYLDSQIVGILNKLNNITLQNYSIASEEISLGEASGTESSSGGESSSSGSSSSSEEEQKQPSSQEQANSGSENTNITTSQMQASPTMDSGQGDIDWNEIKNEIEIINDAWAVILLDLTSLNVDNTQILNFSTTLDDSILSIKEENKGATLTNVAKLYSFIPIYENAISSSNSTKNIKQAKSYLLNAYSLVNSDDWTGVENNISECERAYSNIINDIEYVKDKEYKVNRTYVLINELKNSLTYKDKNLFYVKYKNLLESINTL